MNKKKIKIDLTLLEPIDKLSGDEEALHKLLHEGKFVFHHDQKTLNHYAEIFKNNAKQRKAISLRIPKQDYFAIKAKATHLGIPYQALINLLIHRYVNDDLNAPI